MQAHCRRSEAFILSGNRETTQWLRMRADARMPLVIGGTDCRLIKYTVRPLLPPHGNNLCYLCLVGMHAAKVKLLMYCVDTRNSCTCTAYRRFQQNAKPHVQCRCCRQRKLLRQVPRRQLQCSDDGLGSLGANEHLGEPEGTFRYLLVIGPEPDVPVDLVTLPEAQASTTRLNSNSCIPSISRNQSRVNGSGMQARESRCGCIAGRGCKDSFPWRKAFLKGTAAWHAIVSPMQPSATLSA